MKNIKKIVITSLLAIIFIGGSFVCAKTKNSSVEMLPAFSSEFKQQDRLWVATFQLAWNEFMNNIVKGYIMFNGGTPQNVKILNRQEFTKNMLSDDSYYTAYGRTSLSLKKQIEDAIWKKFGEKSELLDNINWNDPTNAYLIYSMLLKDFKFTTRFDILKVEKFARSSQKVQYFGIDKNSSQSLYNGVDVLFYNNRFDYAVVLKSAKDEVILYRTNLNFNFEDLYNDLQIKTKKYKGDKKFVAGDQLKVPFMSLKTKTNYKELCNKEILHTNKLYIAQALQTADFNLNNTGVKLKSEAIMDVKFMSMPVTVKKRGRNFFFNNTFVIFMKEKNQSQPYFAMRVRDIDLYKYTGEAR